MKDIVKIKRRAFVFFTLFLIGCSDMPLTDEERLLNMELASYVAGLAYAEFCEGLTADKGYNLSEAQKEILQSNEDFLAEKSRTVRRKRFPDISDSELAEDKKIIFIESKKLVVEQLNEGSCDSLAGELAGKSWKINYTLLLEKNQWNDSAIDDAGISRIVK